MRRVQSHASAFALIAVLGALPAVADTVATPTFTPSPPKNFERELRVTIACSTKDAVIRYTTNGYDPTSSATQYKGQITLTQSTTIKARAFKKGSSDSSVATAVYKLLVATPKFSISPGSSFDDPVTLKIECATSGAKIRYTTNGYDPNNSSTEYKGPITLSDTVTIKARGFKDGMAESVVAVAKYTENNPEVAAVTLSPDPAKVYDGAVIVKLECKTPKAVIRYTLNGTEPTVSSTEYKEPFAFIKSATIKVRAFKTGKKDSPVKTASYKVRALPPVLKPGTGTSFNDPIKVTMSHNLTNAQIRYSLTATEPTTAATLYKEPVEIVDTTTIKARAFVEGMEPSEVVKAEYRETDPDLPIVRFETKTSLLESCYFEDKEVLMLFCDVEGEPAEIRFTIDGSEPTERSMKYDSYIILKETTLVRARGFKHGKKPGPTCQALYVKMTEVDTPYFEPDDGTFDRTTDVVIKCDLDGAEIRYTIDGSEPTKYSDVYEGDPIMLRWTTTIKARAFKRNYLDSKIATGVFEIKRPPQ